MRVDDNSAPAKKSKDSGRKRVNSGNYSYKANAGDKSILHGLASLFAPPKVHAPPRIAPSATDSLRALSDALTNPNSKQSRDYASRYDPKTGMHSNPVRSTAGLPAIPNNSFIRNQQAIASNTAKAAPKVAPKVAPKPAPSVMPSHVTPATHAPLPKPTPAPAATPTGSLGGGGGTSAPAPRAAPVLNSQGENLHDIQTRLGIQDTAGKQVDAELNPQLSALAEQLKQLTGHHTTDVADATSHAARQQTDLAALYDRLTNFTGGVKSTQDANYAGEQKSNADAFAALQDKLGQTYGAGEQNTNNELNRLGLGAVSPAATAAVSRDGQYLKGLTGVNAANAESNVNAQRSGFDSLMSMMQGNAQTEGTVQRGQAARDSAKTLAGLNSAFNDASGTIGTQVSSIKGTRGAKVQQLVDAITHQRAADSQAAETAAFNQQLALSKLGIQQGTLTLNQQKALSQAGLTQAQIAHLGNSDSVAQQNANTNAKRAAAAAAAAASKAAGGGKPPTGIDGAMSILNGYTSSPHQRDVANEFQTIMTGAYNDGGQFNTAGQPIKPGHPAISDPIAMAHAADWFKRNQSKGVTQADYDTLVRALAALTGKVGHA